MVVNQRTVGFSLSIFLGWFYVVWLLTSVPLDLDILSFLGGSMPSGQQRTVASSLIYLSDSLYAVLSATSYTEKSSFFNSLHQLTVEGLIGFNLFKITLFVCFLSLYRLLFITQTLFFHALSLIPQIFL